MDNEIKSIQFNTYYNDNKVYMQWRNLIQLKYNPT